MEIALKHKETGEIFKFFATPDSKRIYQIKRALSGLVNWGLKRSVDDGVEYTLRMITLTVKDGFEYSPKILDRFQANMRAFFAKKKVRFDYVAVIKLQVDRARKYGVNYPHWHIAFCCPRGTFPSYSKANNQFAIWWPYGFSFVSVAKHLPIDERQRNGLIKSIQRELSVGTEKDEPFFDNGSRGWSRSQYPNFFSLPLWARSALEKFFKSTYYILSDVRNFETDYYYRRYGRKVFICGLDSFGGRKKYVPFHFVESPWEIMELGGVLV